MAAFGNLQPFGRLISLALHFLRIDNCWDSKFLLWADAFADAAKVNDTGDVQLEQGYVHIRIQQRNGRKSITTVTGLSKALDLKRILKAIKKEHCCNGTVLKDEDTGTEVLQFQGDQRDPVKAFLLKEEICEKDNIKVHGF